MSLIRRAALRISSSVVLRLRRIGNPVWGSGSHYKLPAAIAGCLVCGLGPLLGLLAVLGVLGSPTNETSLAAEAVTGEPESRAVREAPRQAADGGATAPSERPTDRLLCTPSAGGPLSFAWGPKLGMAAGPAGRFALYTRPNPNSGRPTDSSFPLLDGCGSGAPSYTNYAAVRIKGPGVNPDGDDAPGRRVASLGLSTLKRSTTKAGEDELRLTTLHDVGAGIYIRQDLSLYHPSGETVAGLQIQYRVANHSDRPRTVAVRSTLNPGLTPAASDSGDSSSSRARYIVEGPSGSPLLRVRYEREIGASVISGVTPTSSSTPYRWTPGLIGPPPEAIVFAAPSTLYTADFTHEPRLAYPLPPAAAFAVFWKGLRLAPGESVTLSHRYGLDQRASSASGQGRGLRPEGPGELRGLGVRFND